MSFLAYLFIALVILFEGLYGISISTSLSVGIFSSILIFSSSSFMSDSISESSDNSLDFAFSTFNIDSDDSDFASFSISTPLSSQVVELESGPRENGCMVVISPVLSGATKLDDGGLSMCLTLRVSLYD